MSDRTLARFEVALDVKMDLPPAALHRIAAALQVRPEPLTRQMPYTMASLMPTEMPDCSSNRN